MPRAHAYVVALTGGIASGKSAVAERFAARGVEIVDADLVAREVVAPGTPGLAEIAQAFGGDLIDADGHLRRRALRERVFGDAAARRRLEAIVHPRVRARLHERARNARGPYLVLAIPLLVESDGAYDWVDRVLLVDVPREVQIARLTARDATTPALAEAMLAAQATREARLARADDVIVNDGSLEALDAEVERLHRDYLRRASGR